MTRLALTPDVVAQSLRRLLPLAAPSPSALALELQTQLQLGITHSNNPTHCDDATHNARHIAVSGPGYNRTIY
jgi:hypothetical protein